MPFKSPLFFAALILAGCGGGSSGGSSSATKGEALVLTAQGGHSATADGSVALDLPAGAVARTERTLATKPGSLPDPSRIVGTGVVLSSVKLAASGTLTLAYAASAVPSGTLETDLAIYRLEGKVWSLVGGKVDATNHTLAAPITALGTFAILTPETASLVAEATLVSGFPTVRVTWNPAGFSAPGGTPSRWQVYRNDVGGVPVLQAPAAATSVQENDSLSSITYDDYLLPAGTGLASLGSVSPGNASLTYTPSLTPGKPVRYSAQLVYSVPTETSGSYTVGGVTVPYTPPSLLYFLSGKSVSGQATPLAEPKTLSPLGNGRLNGTSVDFEFQSVGGANASLEYVIEVASEGDFGEPAKVLRTGPFRLSGSGAVVRTIDLATGPSGFAVYGAALGWRVGVRNPTDVPGPVPDAKTGLRYAYGQAAPVFPQIPPSPTAG